MDEDEGPRLTAGTVADQRSSYVVSLDAKAMGEYGKRLLWRSPAVEAYRTFRSACVRRTAGGIPPYPAMPRDLKQLAAEAKTDAPAEDAALARDLLAHPAAVQAPARFWASYQNTLKRAAGHDPGLAEVLLPLMPALPGKDFEEGEELWLGILEDCGALDLVADPTKTAPVESATAWLQELIRRGSDVHDNDSELYIGKTLWHSRKLHDLIVRMAPKLLAERDDAGATLAVCDRPNADIGLIDVCLAVGLRPADPTEDFGFDLPEYLRRDSGRDLLACARDPRLRPTLLLAFCCLRFSKGKRALATLAGRVAAVPGLRDVISEWIMTQAEETVGVALLSLSALERSLDHWTMVDFAPILSIHPETIRRVVELDLAPALGQALRAHIVDKDNWPAAAQDPAGSAALRTLTDGDARALLDRSTSEEAARAAVGELLPQITDARLHAGVAGYLVVARRCELKIKRLRNSLAAAVSGSATGSAAPADLAAAERESEISRRVMFPRARRGLCGGDAGDRDHGVPNPVEVLGLLGRLLTAREPPAPEEGARLVEYARLTSGGNAYRELIETVLAARALAFRATSPATGAAERAAVLAFLDAVDASGLRTPGSALRLISAAPNADVPVHADRGRTFETAHGRAVVLIPAHTRTRTPPTSRQSASACELVEYSRDGRFSDVPGWEILKRSNAIPWAPAGGIAEFCRTVRGRGVTPWRADLLPRIMLDHGLTEPEARILLSGLAPVATAPDTLSNGRKVDKRPSVELLALLGMTSEHVLSASRRFAAIPHDRQRARFVASLLPDRFEELWEAPEGSGPAPPQQRATSPAAAPGRD